MSWFLCLLLVMSLAVNILLALILADIRTEKKLAAAAVNNDLDAQVLRIVNGR